jgi:hypothetical protein
MSAKNRSKLGVAAGIRLSRKAYTLLSEAKFFQFFLDSPDSTAMRHCLKGPQPNSLLGSLRWQTENLASLMSRSGTACKETSTMPIPT